MDNKKRPVHQFEISKLKNATQDEVIKDRTLSEGFKPLRNATEHINTKEVQSQLGGNDFTEKIAKLRALKALGKKAMGIIPLAGTIGGLMSGDPAMAAEEAAGDIPILGQAYEAMRPADTGNVDEERQMIAERNARADYDQSPARLARLRALQGMR